MTNASTRTTNTLYCCIGSIDRTCKVWDVQSGTCIHTLRGHNDEILDVKYNTTGTKIATASADGTARVYNTMTGACHTILTGHEGEISKVALDPLYNVPYLLCIKIIFQMFYYPNYFYLLLIRLFVYLFICLSICICFDRSHSTHRAAGYSPHLRINRRGFGRPRRAIACKY